MKKALIFLLSFALFAPGVLAATIVSEYQSVVDQNELQEMAPVIITSTSDGDITAEHGIRILLNPDMMVLFDDADLSITGAAIDNGKVNLNVKPQYASDYKSVYFPVMENFTATDWLSIQGLYLRGYHEGFNDQKLGLDLDGDMQAEVEDINVYRVGNNVKTDIVAPFPVAEAKYVKNANGSVTLTWNLPPDYDYQETIIDRTRVKNGYTQTATVYSDYLGSYTDSDMTGVTALSYTLWAKDDAGNQSEPVTLEVDLSAPVEEAEPPAEEPSPEPSLPETEVEELSRLLNYYNVRYSIKCLPSGVPVAENNSACLWARIDLIYAQEMTGEVKVDGLALTDRDLELMAARRQWPEQRYEENCILAETPASYCSALGKALDRISYFLD